jgi:hypothetical protein
MLNKGRGPLQMSVMHIRRCLFRVGSANEKSNQQGQDGYVDYNNLTTTSKRLPARRRSARPQLMDTAALHRRTIPRHAVAHPAVRPAAVRRPVFEVIPLLDLR